MSGTTCSRSWLSSPAKAMAAERVHDALEDPDLAARQQGAIENPPQLPHHVLLRRSLEEAGRVQQGVQPPVEPLQIFLRRKIGSGGGAGGVRAPGRHGRG